jgi:penicillin-binding protein 1A
VPEGCEFIKIDRFSGARLSGDASGDNVVSECFREGEFINFGQTFDGGFAMGADLPLVEAVGGVTAKEVTTSTGKKAVVGLKAGFGTLSSGGLY